MQIFVLHVLGDVISPPIIGAMSDSTGSLGLSLQICWIMLLVAGLCWWVSYHFLDPLPVDDSDDDSDSESSSTFSGSSHSTFRSLVRSDRRISTFYSLFTTIEED